MSGWIYNLYLSRVTSAGYALSEADRTRLVQAVYESGKQAGAVEIVNCQSTWASEHWNYFGLERFPSAEALMAHKQRIFNLGWMNVLDIHVLLGSSNALAEPVPPPADGTMPIYSLWMGRMTAAFIALPDERKKALFGQVENAMKEVGVQTIVMCDCWSTDRYQHFGIEQYPNLGAVMEYTRCLRELNWFQYIESESFLGVYNAQGGG